MPGKPTMPNTPDMVDSVNERKVTIDDISEQLEISVDTAHKIVQDDLTFLRSVVAIYLAFLFGCGTRPYEWGTQ